MTKIIQGTKTMFREHDIKPTEKLLEQVCESVKEFFTTRHFMEGYHYHIDSIPETFSMVYTMSENIDGLSAKVFKGAFKIVVQKAVIDVCKEVNQNAYSNQSGS